MAAATATENEQKKNKKQRGATTGCRKSGEDEEKGKKNTNRIKMRFKCKVDLLLA